MGAEDPTKFKNPYRIVVELLIYGYIKELERQINHTIIPTDVIDILIGYFEETNSETECFRQHHDSVAVDLYKIGDHGYINKDVLNMDIDDYMKNALFLPNMIGNCIDKWYCVRHQHKSFFGLFGGYTLELKTFFFAKIKTHDKDKVQFMVTVLMDSHNVSVDTDSSSCDSSD